MLADLLLIMRTYADQLHKVQIYEVTIDGSAYGYPS